MGAISIQNPFTVTESIGGVANTTFASETYTVSVGGGCGTFDIVFTGLDTAGNPANVGYYDNNLGIGVAAAPFATDERINIGETLIVTFNNFTGCLTTQTGGGPTIFLESFDLGRWGNNGADGGVFGYDTGHQTGSFTIGDYTNAAGGTADVNIWQGGDVYNFGTVHPNAPTPPFPAISPGIVLEEGDQITFLSNDGNPGWDLEGLSFRVIPEPSRALLGSISLGIFLLRRTRS